MPYYGRIQDSPDARDKKFSISARVPLPRYSGDMRTGLRLPHYNQGPLGSCTANTGVLYRRWLYQKFSKTPEKDRDLSRLFLYYAERCLSWNNSINEDSGAAMRDICIVLNRIGVCAEEDFPYDPKKFSIEPPEQAVLNAADRKIGAYHRIEDLYSLKACLSTGPVHYPVMIGFPVFPSFDRIGKDGRMPMPAANEQSLGGHAVFGFDFDDDRYGGTVGIQNSWGAEWGAHGDFFMPYEFLTTYWAAIDVWMMHLGEPW